MDTVSMVREVCRDHIRSIDTIRWGVWTLFGDDVTDADVLIALEKLEADGEVERITFGDGSEWWRLP